MQAAWSTVSSSFSQFLTNIFYEKYIVFDIFKYVTTYVLIHVQCNLQAIQICIINRCTCTIFLPAEVHVRQMRKSTRPTSCILAHICGRTISNLHVTPTDITPDINVIALSQSRHTPQWLHVMDMYISTMYASWYSHSSVPVLFISKTFHQIGHIHKLLYQIK